MSASTSAPKPLTRRQLDEQHCEVPGCTHEDHSIIFLNQRCHPHADTEASYNKLTGVLHVACAQCKRPVANIKVAAE